MSERADPLQGIEPAAGQARPEAANDAEASTPPVYEKPVIRKYDQIDQVKPYGPSELEAG
jgi:hypothetical protein